MNEQVLDLLRERKYPEIREILKKMNPADIAALLDEAPEESLTLLFRMLPKELASEAFVDMDGDVQETLIQAFSDSELRAVMDLLYLDDAVDLIEEMPANVVKRILAHTAPAMRAEINQLLQYPKDSAGSIMTTEYVDLKQDMTVRDAFRRIRRTGVDKETIYTCYVTDESRVLIGLVTAKTLLLSDSDCMLRDIMETNIIYANTLDDQEEVTLQFSKYGVLALPVVDGEQRLVGIITVDDAIDVIQEENTEDFTKMAAMQPMEDGYFKTSVLNHAKNRIIWLLFLMLSATLTGLIITRYEEAFAAVPLLIASLPMLMDTGGNCGSQASTLVIRGLALDEIRFKDFFRVFFKEFRISLLVGALLAVINGVRLMLMYRDPALAMVVGITLFATVIIAKLLGCCLPMLAKKLKLDPAIMASPIITTIVDAAAVLIYFNIAIVLMNL